VSNYKSFVTACRKLDAKKYSDLLASVRAKLPTLDDVTTERHEINLWQTAKENSDDAADHLQAALRLVLGLVARHGASPDTIERAIGPDRIQLDDYPINIDTIAARARTRWPTMTVGDWIADMLAWILAAHRQVAFRKLSQSGDDTRRLRMGDEGLYFDGDMVDVARTLPRLRPALRFLRDLGLVERAQSGHLPVPTSNALEFVQQVINAG
jgi:hypothetical protein